MRFLFAFVLAAGCGGLPASTSTSPKNDAAETVADSGSAPTDARNDGGASPHPDSGDTSAEDGGAAAKTASLSWNIPATYTDGTALVVAGYHIYYGIASRVYGTPLDVKTATSYVFTPKSAATYYFAVTAYDLSGSESAPSDEVSKVLE